MREFFKKIAEQIYNAPDPINFYFELVRYFEAEDFLIGKVNLLEYIWRLNNDNELLLEIGDIFFEFEKDSGSAYKYYYEYFKRKSEKGFSNFLNVYNQRNNITFCDEEMEFLHENSELTKLYGKFAVIIVILYYLHSKNEYQLLLDIEAYLDKIKSEIEEFVFNSCNTNYPELVQIQEDIKSMSEVLSQTAHHNDINYLAIKFNPKNEQAYINILDDLLTYKNYKEALSFYNNEYAPIFGKSPVQDLIPVCWQFVEIFGKQYNFYKSVFYQKLALEFELEA